MATLRLPNQKLDYNIREVWADNFEAEFVAMRQAMEQYPYVSMVCLALSR